MSQSFRFTPKTRSKLSTLVSNSSDTETSSVESIGSSDDELDPAIRKPPPPRKPTVSRLSFPFVKAAKNPQSQKPVTLPKDAPGCSMGNSQPSNLLASKPGRIPNLNPGVAPELSPLFSYRPNCNPQRHNYCHRGYSRHGLAHTKWFWATHEEEWEDKLGPVRKNKPKLDDLFVATALDDSPPSLRDSHFLKGKTPMHPAYQLQHKLPPMTIHPRRGDLSALRDPYCTEIDRSFVEFPMWTIGKTLWMHDVHVATLDRMWSDFENQNLSDIYDETESESDPLETPSSSSSVIFSDDSDSTLVDSESEMSPTGTAQVLLSEKKLIIDNDNQNGIRHSDHQFTSSTKLVLYRPSWWQTAYSPPSRRSDYPSSHAKKRESVGSWTMNCYQRWEYMAKVPQCDSSVDMQLGCHEASTSSI